MSKTTPTILADAGGPNSVDVEFTDAPTAYATLDTSFFITAFC